MRTLEADDAYTEQLSKLGNLPFVEEVLRGITNGIASCAEAFDLVPGYTQLRIAKTDDFDTVAGSLPPLRMYFRILDNNRVRLMWIERIDDDPGLLDE